MSFSLLNENKVASNESSPFCICVWYIFNKLYEYSEYYSIYVFFLAIWCLKWKKRKMAFDYICWYETDHQVLYPVRSTLVKFLIYSRTKWGYFAWSYYHLSYIFCLSTNRINRANLVHLIFHFNSLGVTLLYNISLFVRFISKRSL